MLKTSFFALAVAVLATTLAAAHAAAATAVEISVAPSAIASGDKVVVRSLTVTSKQSDLSNLDEGDFAFRKVGTDDASDHVESVAADCNKVRCVLTIRVVGGATGKVDLHVANQGKSATIVVKDKTQIQNEQTRANAAAAFSASKKLEAAQKTATEVANSAKLAQQDLYVSLFGGKTSEDVQIAGEIPTIKTRLEALEARSTGISEDRARQIASEVVAPVNTRVSQVANATAELVESQSVAQYTDTRSGFLGIGRKIEAKVAVVQNPARATLAARLRELAK